MRSGSKSGVIAASLLIASLALGATGCGTKQASPPNNNAGLRAQNVAPDGTTAKTIRDPAAVAAHLEQLAKGVRGVNGANCVVFGKYAVVGIDVDAALPRSRVGTIKYAVAEAFRKDPYGIDAVVTADMDLGQRLREIRQDVANGRPIAGFAEELADIVGRLVPQMPRSVVPPASPDGNTGVNLDRKNGVGQMSTGGEHGTHATSKGGAKPIPKGNSGTRAQSSGADGGYHAQSANTGGGPVVYEKAWDRAKMLPSGRASGGNGGGGYHAQSANTGGGPVVYEKAWDRAKELPAK